MMRDHWLIARKFLEYEKTLLVEGDEETRDLTRHYIETQPHAFVIGCLMDKQFNYKKAWKIPQTIGERLGCFDVEFLLQNTKQIEYLFTKEKLHRYPEKAASEMIDALERIKTVYGGNASKIWKPRKSAVEVIPAFLDFKGIGPKIANMAVKILDRYFNFPGKQFIDISVDTHVRRVFGRTGLVENSDLGPEHNHRVVYKARELHSKYPAVLDTAAWSIGINYCHPKTPNCKSCPLKSLCAHSRTRGITNN